jgi:hypothetical protein
MAISNVLFHRPHRFLKIPPENTWPDFGRLQTHTGDLSCYSGRLHIGLSTGRQQWTELIKFQQTVFKEIRKEQSRDRYFCSSRHVLFLMNSILQPHWQLLSYIYIVLWQCRLSIKTSFIYYIMSIGNPMAYAAKKWYFCYIRDIMHIQAAYSETFKILLVMSSLQSSTEETALLTVISWMQFNY